MHTEIHTLAHGNKHENGIFQYHLCESLVIYSPTQTRLLVISVNRTVCILPVAISLLLTLRCASTPSTLENPDRFNGTIMLRGKQATGAAAPRAV